MPQNASDTAISVLSDWWQAMGVDVEPQSAAQPRRPASPDDAAKQTGQAIPQPSPQAGSKASHAARKNAPERFVESWTEDARRAAAEATELGALKTAIEAFDGSPLKPFAKHAVVYDGVEQADVIVIGESPGHQEDEAGLPFIGPAGQLLDRMLATIRLSRETNTLITNVNYWRTPANRNPDPDELAVCRPFVDRIFDICAPKLIIAAGGVSAQTLLQTKTGIMRLRGQLTSYQTESGQPFDILPIFHPAYLLRRPQDKSRAWRDLLQARAVLRERGLEL